MLVLLLLMMLRIVACSSIISMVLGFTVKTTSSCSRTKITTPQKIRQASSRLDLAPEAIAAGAGAVVLGGCLLWFSGTEEREKQAQYTEWERKEEDYQKERARKAYVEPQEKWTLEELKQYDGSKDPDGPILIAAAGQVFNVWRGRHFYSPGCEYHVFAGRDATRLLAKFRTEEEEEEEKSKQLTPAERATLEGYLWTFKNKYDNVGALEGFDPKDLDMW